MSEDEIEHSLKTNAKILLYWDLLAVWGTIHSHFAAPNPISIDTMVSTNDQKRTLYSIFGSSSKPNT